jgi:ribosomal protein S18 acetylase RimI-like enzyme
MHVRLANLHDPGDARWVVDLLDMYCRDEFGDGVPLSAQARENLIPGLIQHGGARVFLAFESAAQGARGNGLAICLLGFSSFRGARLLNIHDIAVSPEARGKGVGAALLQALEDDAKALGCCKITMEVRSDNERAKTLYQRIGYHGSEPESWFWSKLLKD